MQPCALNDVGRRAACRSLVSISNVPGRREPKRRAGNDASLNVEAVHAAVQRYLRFVETSLGWHEIEFVRWYVWRVRNQHVDATPQRRWQRLVQVALINVAIDIALGALHGRRINIDGVEFNALDGGERSTDST